jgi:Arc/MetJ-type ribon-helix-helix transcriptional regulator
MMVPKRGYRSLIITEPLHKRLKQHVEDSQGRYVSVSEVVREAIWKFLNKNK